ncbi:hypothetical protein AAVH_32388, partial [Aphelenchoides avenae]
MAPSKKSAAERVVELRKLPMRRAKSWAIKKIKKGRRANTIRLPTEILIDVLSPLNRFDLDTVRFTGRGFLNVIAEHMRSICLREITYVNIRCADPATNSVKVDIQAKRKKESVSLQLEDTKNEAIESLNIAVTNGVITGGIFIDAIEVDADFVARMQAVGNHVKFEGYVNLHSVRFQGKTEPVALLDCFPHVKSYGDRDCSTDINDAFMAWCLQKGISRLTVDFDAKITNAGIKEFCFGGADPGTDRRELRVCQLMPFSEAFLDELVELNTSCGHSGPMYARVNIEWIELDPAKYKEFVTTEARRRTVIHDFRFPKRFRVRYTGS